ncbi:MAG TPA: SDR family NAD(P)-dependent oxidoreductase, partial [Candidatus Dormibacteraeota bacterium]
MPLKPSDDWSGKRVVVTGAGGFIGSHLTERLVNLGASTTAFLRYNSRSDVGLIDECPAEVRSEIHVAWGDLGDPDSVRLALRKADVVFHLGALVGIPYSYEAPRQYVDANVLGTLNVLEAARAGDVGRVVHTSTSEVYGTPLYTPIDEKHPLQGQSPYSASKIGADKLAESFWRTYKLPIATLRPFNTFGPRQSARAILPTIIRQALKGSEIRLGSLTPIRDMNFVGDTVDGFIRIASSDAALGRVVNIGSGRGLTVGEMVESVSKALEKTIAVVGDPDRVRPPNSEVEALIADATLAHQLFEWSSVTPFEEGLKRTIEWFS